MRVSPFGHLRIDGYLRLPEAFRSLSRPSSAFSAKASALRPFCLILHVYCSVSIRFFRSLSRSCFRSFLSGLISYFQFSRCISSGRAGQLGLSRLELPTSRLSGVRSNLLSYKPASDGDEEIRTLDPLLAGQVLSQLSYVPSSKRVCRQPPALPHRLQCSTIGRTGLNRRVRNGNGCAPCTHRHRRSSLPFGQLNSKTHRGLSASLLTHP